MTVILIYASSSNCTIGDKGKLPWNLPMDLKLFQQKTMNHTVIMGHGTWHCLGETHLYGRTNIVLSKLPKVRGRPDHIFSSLVDLAKFIVAENTYFIIGGAVLFNNILASSIKVDEMYVSRIPKHLKGDTSFYNTGQFILTEKTRYEGFDFLKYISTKDPALNEIEYLNLLNRVLKEGIEQPDRTGVGTLSIFGYQMKFDLKRNFPLLTTKRMAWTAIQEELFFFLSGKTNTKELEARGVSIWRGNTTREFLDARGLNYPEGEMGPMYGYQWRNYGGAGLDQLEWVIKEIEINPFSRRLIITTFNPLDAEKGVLWPCHGIVLQFFCREKDNQKYLSALMYQRSADIFLGLPFNIASYSLLLHIVSNRVGMIADELIVQIGHAHLYKNHIQQAEIQLKRKPLIQPQIEIIKQIVSLDSLDKSYIKLWGYFYWPQIGAKMAV